MGEMAVTDMVEKVAKALHEAAYAAVPWDKLADWSKERWRNYARAAISALMEPTEDMRAVIEPALDAAYNGTKDCSVESSGVQIYQAMLKNALGD